MGCLMGKVGFISTMAAFFKDASIWAKHRVMTISSFILMDRSIEEVSSTL